MMNGSDMIDEDRKGFLIPLWFVCESITESDMNLASMLFGCTMAIAVFVIFKGGNQTIRTWKRSAKVTPYIIMIWLELVVSLGLSVETWIYLRGYAPASFWIFFFVVFFWSLSIQFILQIIINRLSLLVAVPGHATKMKWIFGLLITTINISVFCIWVPARLQVNHTFIRMNCVWDRVEKAIFACSDLSLNLYFVYLIRSRLINNGLTKYIRVYRMNLVLVSISMVLDVVMIALMSLPNSFVYLLFHPVAYLSKLMIEMNMAKLILKVAKASNPVSGTTLLGSGRHHQQCDNLCRIMSEIHYREPVQGRCVYVYAEDAESTDFPGIRRTTETSVVVEDGSRRCSSPTIPLPARALTTQS
ncbi:hypothetical protein GGR54DRAFT_340199 [Hypoxylon sp. NC1633]|nr:hypothetical protein GGR54DRAFT_340199 [Hypoxylon sp. NC1633]